MFYYNKSTYLYGSSLLGTVPHGFGTKLSADGRNIQVIHSILNASKVPYKAIVVPQQTHSTNVVTVTGTVSDRDTIALENTDGIVTGEKGIVLTVLTADCVPILYIDDVAHVIGISHGGWKGTHNNIPEKVIEKMELLGAVRNRIKVAVGPSIKSCCYEIYGARYEQFRTMFGDTVFAKRDGKIYLRLDRAQELLLQHSGILQNHIDISRNCTACDSTIFYSYQRDKGIEGEMISFIMLS